MPASASRSTSKLSRSALDGRPLALVLITHGHSDHVNGVPAIVARWPDVRVRRFGSGDHPLEDGEVIAAGDGTVTALHTPGHAPDHCCFLAGGDVLLRRSGSAWRHDRDSRRPRR